jgi:glycosyltransferase involved in cell wall biosynthesis
MSKPKLIRITTVPLSLEKLLENQLPFMAQDYEVIAISSDKDSLEKVGKLQRVSTYCVELTRKITPVADLRALVRLYCFLRRTKPLIVHTHTPKAGVIGMVASKFAGVPHRLHTVAGLPLLEASGPKRKLLNWVEKVTYLCATHVYPNSKGLYDIILKEKFCNDKKLKVIGNGSSNGIDTGYFDKGRIGIADREKLKYYLGIAPRDLVFIFVGRLVSDKGVNELVTAFLKLQAEYSNVKLILLGWLEDKLDPLKKETKQAMAQCQNIIVVDYHSDVRPYLAISDVLAFPSYREGFPNVVMQAGAMGLPSIVTNINGCNEIIEHGRNGLIIDPKDSNQLYEAMKLLSNDDDLRIKLKENARPMIVDRYEQQMLWNALLKEYKRLENNV